MEYFTQKQLTKVCVMRVVNRLLKVKSHQKKLFTWDRWYGTELDRMMAVALFKVKYSQ